MSLRTQGELQAGAALARIFEESQDATEAKLETFPRYVRRQTLKRFLSMYEIFKLVLPVKGSVVDCGTYRGFSLMTWAHVSSILEPENLTRRIYGFDTFQGFPSAGEQDGSLRGYPQAGDLASDSYGELQRLIEQHDANRPIGHIPKILIVKGDALETMPQFVQDAPHLMVSLLFLDFDLYAPTRAAIEIFLPRMPQGAIIAFDELDNPRWPGETLALLETLGIRNLRLERIPWDPYIAYARLGPDDRT